MLPKQRSEEQSIGMIRTDYSTAVGEAPHGEIAKDLINMPVYEIEKQFPARSREQHADRPATPDEEIHPEDNDAAFVQGDHLLLQMPLTHR